MVIQHPSPPVSRNRLAQELPPGSTVEFSHSFFLLQNCIFRGSGGCRTAIQVCRTTFHVYCMVCGIWKVIFAFVSPLGSLRRNQPLVPRSNIAGFSTRGGGGAFSAIKARSQRPSTCEAHSKSEFFFYKKKKHHKTQPHDARIHALDSFSSGQLITRRLHRHGRVELRSRFLIELHSDAMSPPFLPCPPATPPPPIHPS